MGEPTKRSAIAIGAGLLGVAIFLGWPRTAETPPPAPRIVKPRPTERATPPRAPRAEGPSPAAPPAPATPRGGPTVERNERGALAQLRTAEGREWRIDRDDAGRPIRIVGPAGSTKLERDASGRVVARIDATGARTTIRHDRQGRPISFETGQTEESLRYDASGRLVEARAGLERLSFTFDDTADPVAQVRVEDHAAGVAIDYRCASGQQEVRSPFGTSTWTQDVMGRLVRLETPAGAFTWEYDDATRGVVRTAPNGVRTRVSWDDASRTERVVAAGPSGDVVRLARTWSESNHVEAIERDGERSQFGYDAAGQLMSLVAPDGTSRHLRHDADGNRTADGSTTFEHDARGRLTRASDGRRFVHDDAGRLLSVATGSGEDTFTYDAFGRLVSARRAGGPRVTYGYDGVGRVVMRDVDGAVTRFVHDGPRLLAELGPGERRRTYVYGPGLDEPLAYRDGDGAWIFLHADTLGHVLAYSDETGARVDSTALDPWGVTTRATTEPRPAFFSGRLIDPVTGLVHLRARFYDPALGRFLTPDPIGLLGGTNAYAYVRNDPLGRIDPLGLFEEVPPWLRHVIGRAGDALMPLPVTVPVEAAALALWSNLDADTRERLRESPRSELFAVELDRRVSEITRGYEASARSLLFLKGEVIGLGRGLAAMVEAAPELANFAVDLGATAIALAHDGLLGDENSWTATHENRSGLSHLFERGEGGKLITDAFTLAPERIAEASQKTGILVEQHQYQAAGEVFGEVVLLEAANWIVLATSLAKQGINVSRLTAAERHALIREAMAIGYKPGVGGAAVQRLAAFISNRRNARGPAAAAASAAPVAAVAARNGLVQVLDPDAPRARAVPGDGAVAEAPPTAAELPADASASTARISGRTDTTSASARDANRARGPPDPEASNAPEASRKPERADEGADTRSVPGRGPGRHSSGRRIESAPRDSTISAFEEGVVQSAKGSGERIIGHGDKSTRRALDAPRDKHMVDVLSEKGGRYHLREVKESRNGGGVEVGDALQQFQDTAELVRARDPAALFGKMELSVPQEACFTGNYRVEGGILKSGENDLWSPVKVAGRVVTVKRY